MVLRSFGIRIWDELKKEYIENANFEFKNGKLSIAGFDKEKIHIEQATHESDCNLNEIFENDIVDIEGRSYVVFFEQGRMKISPIQVKAGVELSVFLKGYKKKYKEDTTSRINNFLEIIGRVENF